MIKYEIVNEPNMQQANVKQVKLCHDGGGNISFRIKDDSDKWQPICYLSANGTLELMPWDDQYTISGIQKEGRYIKVIK